jgi:hypothetical protein
VTPPFDIEPLLAELREIAGAFGRDGWEADVARADAFVERLYEVGRALELQPEALASWRRFRDETAPRVVANAGGLSRYAHGTDARLHETFQVGDEWLIISRRRSALAFLTALYEGTELDEWRSDLEPADIDELLRHRCKTDGYVAPDDVPEGIPSSHWWWRCPNVD